jgi:alpha-beta hydrolase superfamily lysophospholipase
VNEASAFLTGARGRRIFWRTWTPDGPPGAVVVIAHGAGEHSGRYDHVAARLVDAGYAVYALDHRGHGRSDGPRALIEQVDLAVSDLDQLVVLAATAQPGLPVFLLGHSMGAMIALRYAPLHQDRLAGVILSGALAALEDVPAPLRLVGQLLSRIAPRTPLIAIDPALVSRDPAVVRAYRDDPLVHHGKLPARTAAQIADTVASFPQTVGAITVPILIMYGTADALCPPAGSVMVGERVGSADRTVTPYAGLFHEILNEPEREAVLDEICGWLAARAAGAAVPADGSAGSSSS